MAIEETKNKSLLARYLTDQYTKVMSGSGDFDVLVDEKPDKRFMVGTLAANRVVKNFQGEYDENETTKWTSIPSISLTFIIKKDSKGKLVISLNGYLYYRIEPIYSHQVKRYLEKYSRQYGEEFKDIESLLRHLEEKGITTLEVSTFYKRIKLRDIVGPISIPVSTLLDKKKTSLQDHISSALRKASSNLLKEAVAGTIGQVALRDVKDEASFTEMTRVDAERHMAPTWDIDIVLESIEQGDDVRMTARLVNLTNVPEASGPVSFSPTVFNAGLAIVGDGVEFQDIKLDFFREDYRQSPVVRSIAENATSYYSKKKNMISTENVPLYLQKRTVTKDNNRKNLEFKALINDPIRNLEEIARAMEHDYDAVYKQYLETRDKAEAPEALPERSMEKYERDLDTYRQEVRRFKAGIEILRRKDLALRAFRYMNESFCERCYPSQSVYPGWHAFQLVFIVSLINDIVQSEYRDDPALQLSNPEIVDVLYFPTGGGKTEAFFGAIVFAAFFDRLRGKKDGVTAMVKYPLRLLSMDQLDRAITTMTKAERVRSRHNDVSNGAPFTVGYFVGQDNTPNEIKNPAEVESGAIDDVNERFRVIDTCPSCGKQSVGISFDRESWRLVHRCQADGCGKEVPIYSIDNEIYRYLPTLIIGTIDKLALVGYQTKIKSIFGHVQGVCPHHGYSSTSKCSAPYEAHCRQPLQPIKERKDPVPTLMIQDELHLVRESLGTFDSHYETFLQLYTSKLIDEKWRKKMKFIGASATISHYDDHVWNLYHKDARQFPSPYPYPTVGENFYSYIDEDDVSRAIIGFCPYGKSITDSVWESVTAFRELVYQKLSNVHRTYLELKTRGFTGSEDELGRYLDQYWISIIYNTRKQDAVSLHGALQNQGNNYLKEKGISEYKIDQMTGDESARHIREIRDSIKNQSANFGGLNVILATSTISHGIDEEAFNNIFFYGMPSNTAEYVQTYSRVGRKYSGIVVDIIRLARERDRSYLKNFLLFHRYKDELIEPVPINRWAKNAVYSTFPGILSAMFLQYYEPNIGDKTGNLFYAQNVKKGLKLGLIKQDELIRLMKESYGCGVSEKVSHIYEEIIEAEVKLFVAELENNPINEDMKIGEAIERFTSHRKAPMRSLRDVDEQLEIVAD